MFIKEWAIVLSLMQLMTCSQAENIFTFMPGFGVFQQKKLKG